MSAPSEFYFACRNGYIATVQNLLTNLSNEEKNRIEPNGSTALHAASYFGHHAIAKLLLENGFPTWIRNQYGNTPFDEAKDEQMQKLFHRPNQNNDSSRFASTDDCFNIVTRSNTSSEDDDNMPKGFVDGYKHVGTQREREAAVEKIVHAQMMKYCLKKFQISDTCKDLLKLLKKTVPESHHEYTLAHRCFEQFRRENNVEELIRLYSLQTDFYGSLQKNVNSFAIELYSYLPSLQNRAFQGGRTYRGLVLTNKSLEDYRWAAKDKGRMIEIKTMASTSTDKKIALLFGQKKQHHGDDLFSVLCVLDFPERCYTAIDLTRGQPITKYSDEKEILLLPGTLFEVQEVSDQPENGWHTILLQNIPVPYETLDKALEELKTTGKLLFFRKLDFINKYLISSFS